MKTNVQQSEQDSFIDEVLRTVPREHIEPSILTIEQKSGKLKLMSYPLVHFFLAFIGRRDGNLSPEEASSLASKMISYYKPSCISEEEIQKDHYNYAYTRLELNRLYVQYLVVCCNIDPLEAIQAIDDGKFWRRFYPHVKPIESIDSSLPMFYGDAHEVKKAKEIRRKQVADLVILKNHIKNSIEPINRQYIDSLSDESQKQNTWLQYLR